MRSLVLCILCTCSIFAHAANEADLREFFAKNRIGNSPDYGIVIDSVGGPELVITVHGMADDKAACEDIVRRYFGGNARFYQCIPLNSSGPL